MMMRQGTTGSRAECCGCRWQTQWFVTIEMMELQICSLEALPVHDGGSALVVLALGDPHLLEGREGGQDGATDPDRVLALGGCYDLDLHGRGRQRRDFLVHTVRNAGEHGGATRQHNVVVQVLTDIDIALHDGVKGDLVHADRFLANEAGLEEHLGAAEALIAHHDDLTVGQLIGLLHLAGRSSGGEVLLVIQRDVAKLLLNVTHNLTLGGSGERVATLQQDGHQVIREVATSQVHTDNGVGEGITLIDGHRVRHAITGIHHDTSGATGSIKGKHGLDLNVHGGHVEGLKHDLSHLLAVGLGILRRLGQQHGMLLRSHAQLIVKSVVPDLLHVIPV
mmetsp:Transcript_18968/g.33823  ORF Transcript_18968/g.33823 Transcript_18968/m.33823 type:complete len:336 (+) Transcript_18968:245-1252(+)